jgi:copper transport protein
VDAPPEEIVLTFSETVSIGGGGVDVLNSEGEKVQAGDVEADGDTLRVPMPDDLPDGTYVVSYRIVSADGHPVSGGVVFGMGVAPDANAAATAASDVQGWGFWAGVGRLLAYAGALVGAGATVFLSFVADPELPRKPFRWLVPAAVVTTLVAIPILIVSQAARVSGLGWDVLGDTDQLREALGAGLGVQCLLLVLAVVAALASAFSRGTLARVTSVVALVLTAVAFVAWGHARTGEPSWLALIGDAVHVAAGAAWAGGLILLAWVLIGRIGEADAAARTVSRFSALAVLIVIGLAIGGSALAYAELRSVSALWDSDYGRVLLIKLSLVGFVLALAAWNRFRLVPQVAAAATSGPGAVKREAGWRHLRLSVGLEALGIIAVIGVTTVLVEVTPPVTGAETGGIAAAPFHGEAQVADTNLVVDLSPGAAGVNEVHMTYIGADGALADIAESVTLEFSLPDADLGPIERDATLLVGGHYTYEGNDMSIPGEWTMTIVTRLSRFEEERTDFTVPIGA